MTQFTLVVERRPVIELQIAKIRNAFVVDEIVQRIRRPFQAVFLGEAKLVGWEVRHVVFDPQEERREQEAQTKADQGNGNENGNSERGGNGQFHVDHCKRKRGFLTRPGDIADMLSHIVDPENIGTIQPV